MELTALESALAFPRALRWDMHLLFFGFADLRGTVKLTLNRVPDLRNLDLRYQVTF
jgi:hypothetical protein